MVAHKRVLNPQLLHFAYNLSYIVFSWLQWPTKSAAPKNCVNYSINSTTMVSVHINCCLSSTWPGEQLTIHLTTHSVSLQQQLYEDVADLVSLYLLLSCRSTNNSIRRQFSGPNLNTFMYYSASVVDSPIATVN